MHNNSQDNWKRETKYENRKKKKRKTNTNIRATLAPILNNNLSQATYIYIKYIYTDSKDHNL